jgi:outer membrane protein assembly factor BamD
MKNGRRAHASPLRKTFERWAITTRLSIATAAVATSLVFASGCADGGGSLMRTYAPTAGENYELAQAEFAKRDWEDAISYADFVRMRYPFSRHAVDAELLAARANYGLKNYTTARDAFRQFSHMHPSHKHVRNGWVDYMAVVCAFESVPPSTWPLPPDSQLDRTGLDEAYDEILEFFERYSGSPVDVHARDLRARIEKRLLAHDLYVARYHLDRDHPEAAIVRLHAAHARFPESKSAAEVLFLLGLTYLRMDEIEASRDTFTELQTTQAHETRGQQAKYYLDYIYANFGPPDPNRPRPERELETPKSPVHVKEGTVFYAKTVTTPSLMDQARAIESVRIRREKEEHEAALRAATARGEKSFKAGEINSENAATSAPAAEDPNAEEGTQPNSAGVSPGEPASNSPAKGTPEHESPQNVAQPPANQTAPAGESTATAAKPK